MTRGLTATLLICVAAAGVAVGALAIDAGGSGNGAADNGGGTAAGPARPLVIEDFAFSAPPVAPGQTVTVENRDDVPHTVTAADGSFTTDTIDAGSSGTFVAPTAPGTYQFVCSLHPEMNGSLTVEATGGDTGTEPTGGSGGTPGY